METSKRKFWAKEILIFWVSLGVMVVAYLITLGVTEVQIYFKNKKDLAYNAQLDNSKEQKRAEIDSLKKTQFKVNPVQSEENQMLRKELITYMIENRHESKNYLEFIPNYCCDEEEQKELYEILADDGGNDIGQFHEFQSALFGDFLNPDWGVSREKIELLKSELKDLDSKKRNRWYNNNVDFKYFGIAWLLIVYPLRGIIFSIFWAWRTVKEK